MNCKFCNNTGKVFSPSLGNWVPCETENDCTIFGETFSLSKEEKEKDSRKFWNPLKDGLGGNEYESTK